MIEYAKSKGVIDIMLHTNGTNDRGTCRKK